MSSNIQNNLKSLLKKIEFRASYLYKYYYKKYIHYHYNNLIVENLMCNGRCHLVAVFKNYLIEDDNSEYLKRFYRYKESAPRLKKLFLYHDETSVIFPNYTPLIESKYLYNNVIKKQRVIDEQQDLENIRNDQKLNKRKRENTNKEDKVFNSTVFGDILTTSDSVLRIIFGIEKSNGNKNNLNINDKLNLNDNQEIKKNLDNIDNDNNDSDYEEIKQLIKKVEAVEENNKKANTSNSLVGYKLGSNNALKYKLKLLNNPINNHIKSKNSDKLINITNNSTNITSSSNNNNINSNLNLNKIKNNQNLAPTNNFELSKNLINIQKMRNSLVLTNHNKANTFDKNKYNDNLKILNHKKSNSTIPNRTLYGYNFNSNNNNLLSNLINQEKKKKYKNNSNSQSNNTSRVNVNNNNYIHNNNFPHNSKIANNIKFNSSNKSNKALTKIPKIDVHKLEILNRNNDRLLTLTNRNVNRNHHNHILNNPNLFFIETEVLKSERNIMKKKTKKKDNIKNHISPITFSPSNYKSKVIFGRNSNAKLIIINEQNLKTISQNKNNKQYFSNKNINNKSSKKLIINEYNFKTSPNIINNGNYENKYYRRHTNGP